MNTPVVWTEERIAQLKDLWRQGWSAGQIAREFRGLASRCAVLGKVHRLGLSGRKVINPSPRQLGKRVRARISAKIITFPRTEPTSIQTMSDEPEPLNLLLEELTLNACRWPVSDGRPHQFCGHAKTEDSPYCRYHEERSRPESKRGRAA